MTIHPTPRLPATATATPAPRDNHEAAALSAGCRITAAIATLIATATAILAALGGLEWIGNNLPLLGTGLGSVISGGIASYIAVRRMRGDRRATRPAKIAPALPWMLALLSGATGCVAIKAGSNADSASVWAFGVGGDSAANLANVAVTGPGADPAAQTGVSFDSGASAQQTTQALQAILTLGAAMAPMLRPVPAIASAAPAPASAPCPQDTAPLAAPAAAP